MARQASSKIWDDSDSWYTACVGEAGHYYHQALILPAIRRLFDLKKAKSLLDLGCGQGVLARHIPSSVEYWGIDGSEKLLAQAKKLTRRDQAHFICADATEELPIEKRDFDYACFILSLQNMENGLGAIKTASRHLKGGGKLLIVLNHPCFRIPRQSHWGIDEATQIQYRRMNRYLSNERIPIQTHPGKGEQSSTTFSYHHPLSTYAHWLFEAGMSIVNMEEWISDKKSEGSKARMEDRARKEFPLFLALLVEKKSLTE